MEGYSYTQQKGNIEELNKTIKAEVLAAFERGMKDNTTAVLTSFYDGEQMAHSFAGDSNEYIVVASESFINAVAFLIGADHNEEEMENIRYGVKALITRHLLKKAVEDMIG